MAALRTRLVLAIAGVGGLGGALVGYMGARDQPAGVSPSSRPSLTRTGARSSAAEASAEPHGSPDSAPPAVGAAFDGTLRTLIIAGGSYPESTEVSLEQNAALAERVLPSPSLTLFAGGSDSMSVRSLGPSEGASLLRRLGDLFQPRVGRGSTYRKPRLEALPASREQVEHHLQAALRDGTDPLVLYVAAHGEKGATRRENFIALWGGGALSVAELAAIHDRSRRPLVVVSTTCFSGGFADLAFAGADPGAGVTRAPRCGLFAGTWDREASGCDPNPDRRAQESYSQHMLNALVGRDRNAEPADASRFDLDGDGEVSFLEAHTRAAVASTSIDVPTTTSERFLRMVQEERAPVDLALIVEYERVIRGLGERLGLGTEPKARERLEKVAARLDALDGQMRRAEEDLDRRYAALSARLLRRWPVLDDPYHADFQATLSRDAEAIRRVLDDSEEAAAFRASQKKLDQLDAFFADLQVKESLLLRLVRAYETLGLAAALERRGGSDWKHYLQLLECERRVP